MKKGKDHLRRSDGSRIGNLAKPTAGVVGDSITRKIVGEGKPNREAHKLSDFISNNRKKNLKMGLMH